MERHTIIFIVLKAKYNKEVCSPQRKVNAYSHRSSCRHVMVSLLNEYIMFVYKFHTFVIGA